MSDAQDTLQTALARAGKEGAHAADAVLIARDSVAARVRGEEIEWVKQANEHTLGLRVLMRGGAGLRSAITSTSDLSEEAVAHLAEDTVRLARATAEDPTAGLPEGGFASGWPDLALFDRADRTTTLEQRIEWARTAERAARAVDARITKTDCSEMSSSFGHVTYANSIGFSGEYQTASHTLFSSPIASEDGAMQYDSWHSSARRIADLESAEAVGRRAAERALALLGARRVPTCEVPVIFDATTSRSLLGNLLACISGYAVYRGGSFLAERLGEKIASSAVTIVDDGRRPGGLGSRPFDGEGLPTRRTPVVTRGRLDTWLLDSYSGRKLGMASTGNAMRGAGSAPSVGPTNFWLEPGDTTQDEMVRDAGRGLLVTGLFGQGFNPVTGDFSRGARGLWIEGGEPVHPVDEITIAGNLGDMLQGIDAVGRELLWLGRVAAPALRVARMTVAGS